MFLVLSVPSVPLTPIHPERSGNTPDWGVKWPTRCLRVSSRLKPLLSAHPTALSRKHILYCFSPSVRDSPISLGLLRTICFAALPSLWPDAAAVADPFRKHPFNSSATSEPSASVPPSLPCLGQCHGVCACVAHTTADTPKPGLCDDRRPLLSFVACV